MCFTGSGKFRNADTLGTYALTVNNLISFNPVLIDKPDSIWLIAGFQLLEITDQAVCKLNCCSAPCLYRDCQSLRLFENQCL